MPQIYFLLEIHVMIAFFVRKNISIGKVFFLGKKINYFPLYFEKDVFI